MTDPLTDLEVTQLRALLARPTPQASAPITIGPFTNVPAPGSPVRSDWPQNISQYVADRVGVYADGTALAAAAPPNGSLGMQVDTGALYQRVAGAWKLLAGGMDNTQRLSVISGSSATGVGSSAVVIANGNLGTAPFRRMIIATVQLRVDNETANPGTMTVRLDYGSAIAQAAQSFSGGVGELRHYSFSAPITVAAGAASSINMTMVRAAGTLTCKTFADPTINRLTLEALPFP